MNTVHTVIDPAILYFGTPVVVVSSTNEDGTTNVAPISSAWWLGRSCLLGFGARSHTPANILRTGECVLNLPSVTEVAGVDRLARLTGSNPVPPHKQAMGYRFEPDKLGAAGWTTVPSDQVGPPRVAECPVQLEAVLDARHPLAAQDPVRRGHLVALEVRVTRVHIHERLRMDDHANRIDPDRWRPLIMSFCHFYGLGERLHPSRLAEIPESAYRPPRSHPVKSKPSLSSRQGSQNDTRGLASIEDGRSVSERSEFAEAARRRCQTSTPTAVFRNETVSEQETPNDTIDRLEAAS